MEATQATPLTAALPADVEHELGGMAGIAIFDSEQAFDDSVLWPRSQKDNELELTRRFIELGCPEEYQLPERAEADEVQPERAQAARKKRRDCLAKWLNSLRKTA
jgi:hypothetical protein